MTSVQRYYRPELDALRFLAFLSVFFFHGLEFYSFGAFRHMETYHLGWAGQWGVPLFFFLSAFLIVELLLRERTETGTVSLGKFYVRRILRIWPLYFLAIALFALIHVWFPRFNPGPRKTLPYFLLFTGNWYISQHGWIGSGVDPLWSISVEEQFYILIPILAAWGGRAALKAASLLALVGAYITIYMYARVTWTHDNGEWTNSFVQFQFFAGGALLAMALRNRVLTTNWPVRELCLFGGLGCWIVAQTAFGVRGWEPFTTVSQALAGWPLILIGCSLLLFAFLGVPGEFVPNWLRYLGRISFGLYVYHSLVYDFIFAYPGGRLFSPPLLHVWWHLWAVWGYIALVFLISVLLAHLSYRFYERPFLLLKDRFTIVPSRPE